VAVCRREVFEGVPMDRPTDIARDLLPELIAVGRRVGHTPIRADDYLYDIGTPANYRACCEHLRGGG
jgi:NDP-sugar pyrophosphorylase family protein